MRTNRTSMEQRLTIVALAVADFEAANHFYQNVFGWKKLPSSNEHITFFQLNGTLLSLYGRVALAEDAQVPHEGSGFKGFTLAYNTRSEAEVDEIINEMEAKGARVVKRPEKVFWGGYSGYIADPDDNLWEIAWNPYLELDAAGNAIEP